MRSSVATVVVVSGNAVVVVGLVVEVVETVVGSGAGEVATVVVDGAVAGAVVGAVAPSLLHETTMSEAIPTAIDRLIVGTHARP